MTVRAVTAIPATIALHFQYNTGAEFYTRTFECSRFLLTTGDEHLLLQLLAELDRVEILSQLDLEGDLLQE